MFLHYCFTAFQYIIVFSTSLIFPSHHRSTKTHPGPVVHLSDSPKDEGKVSGQIQEAPNTSQFSVHINSVVKHSTAWRHSPSPTALTISSSILNTEFLLLLLISVSLYFSIRHTIEYEELATLLI